MLEPWIEAHSGKRVYFLDPTPEIIDVEDIAHSLSLQCRFSGHTSRFYSVAEHSVRVAQHLSDRGHGPLVVLQGLFHDASEAYLLDVPSPIKQYLGPYKGIENKLMDVIMGVVGARWPMSSAVKEMDAVILKNEARQLLPSKGASWINEYPTPFESNEEVWCLAPDRAKETFRMWYNYLTDEIKETV